MTENPDPDSRRDSLAVLVGSLGWAHRRFFQYLVSTRFWLVMAVSVLATTLAGPFETMAQHGPWSRLAFWGMLLPPAILQQLYVSMWFREYARRTGRPWGWAALLAGLAGSVTILFWAKLANALLVAPEVATPLWLFITYDLFIVVLLTVSVNAFMPTLQPLWWFNRTPRAADLAPIETPAINAAAQHAATTVMPERLTHGDLAVSGPATIPVPGDGAPLGAPRPPEPSPFFDRLPVDLGREIVSIKAANHHIEVTTPLGEARVLMRLADAEAELSALPGMRVHRSWWVNLDHVRGTEPRQGSIDLILASGVRVPVSRALRAEVQEAVEHRLNGTARA